MWKISRQINPCPSGARGRTGLRLVVRTLEVQGRRLLGRSKPAARPLVSDTPMNPQRYHVSSLGCRSSWGLWFYGDTVWLGWKDTLNTMSSFIRTHFLDRGTPLRILEAAHLDGLEGHLWCLLVFHACHMLNTLHQDRSCRILLPTVLLPHLTGLLLRLCVLLTGLSFCLPLLTCDLVHTVSSFWYKLPFPFLWIRMPLSLNVTSLGKHVLISHLPPCTIIWF